MAIQLPPVNLHHLKTLTDDTGIFQHARFCVPLRREGYTTDDNARALIVCSMYHHLKKDVKIEALASVYLAFLGHMQKPQGNFHNFLSYERAFLDNNGSADSVGRALRGLGCVVNSTLPKYLKMRAKEIFDESLQWAWKSKYPRCYASAILGISQYIQAVQRDGLEESTRKLADRLVEMYRNQVESEWKWFEPVLTYDNALLPDALYQAYVITDEQKYLEAAEESMNFLIKTQIIDGVFVPIGNDGWFKRGGNRAVYDQQPLEAAAMIEAVVDAYYATNNKDYVQVANQVFEWFLGRNSLKTTVYCLDTGGCFDGLHSGGVNSNQGAESCVSYLSARLKLEELKRAGLKRKT